MSHRLLVIVLPLLLVAPALASPSAAQTRPAVERLHALRPLLRAYDARPEGTPQVIRTLGELARDLPAREAGEARFLRAVATADLLILARLRHDPALAERVAEAFGATREGLDAALRSELESLRSEPTMSVVDDALAALAPSERSGIPPAEGEHTRRQAIFFARVFDEVLRARDPSDALAELAADPCIDECASTIYEAFGPRGRRAIAAMTSLHDLLRSIERTARLGDPFSGALAREVLVDTVVLRSITLAPRDWASGVRPVEGVDEGSPVDVDAVIVVTGDRVRAGFVPEVLWDAQGRPFLSADGPLLGSDEEAGVALGVAADSPVRPIPDLAAHIAIGVRGAARIALMVEPEVEASVLSRVLVSLDDAGIHPDVLAIAAHDGTVRGVPFEIVEDDAGPVGVFVRLGGFSAWQRGVRTSLPRQRIESRWEFDFDGLEVATRERARHPLTLRYMGTVRADLVLRVALRLASANRPVRLVIR